jgi:hypothetical protein
MGSLVAGQAAAEEEARRLARLEEAKNLYRDTVEVVSETLRSEAVPPIKPRPEKRREERKPAKDHDNEPDFFSLSSPVVDYKV